MDRSPSTVSEELRRNRVRGTYDPGKAHRKALLRRKNARYQGMKVAQDDRLRHFVEERLFDDQSPKAIAGRLKYREENLPYASKNSIYRYIESPYGRRIEYYRKQKQNRRRRSKKRKSVLKNRRSIDERPASINTRKHVGDTECDFIVSGKTGTGILLVTADRKLRISFLEQILTVTIPEVHRAFRRIQKRFPEIRTITTDNDILFQHHQELEKSLSAKIYFCHPGHAWEKGTVENTNKYIRRDIPKGSDISKYSKQFIRSLEEKLNRRSMECLGYRTPSEALTDYRKRRKFSQHKKSGSEEK